MGIAEMCSDCWAAGVVAWGRCYDCAHPILLRRLAWAHLAGLAIVLSFFISYGLAKAL